MTKVELIERLKGYEWTDVEFKRARKGVPEDAYNTVSAFANTSGGWLIFGVRQEKGQFVVSGVEEVDKVQNDFLSCLRAGASSAGPSTCMAISMKSMGRPSSRFISRSFLVRKSPLTSRAIPGNPSSAGEAEMNAARPGNSSGF
ncbi:MAG: ATP-binding protein [Desulfobacteraceae bacterium]|nr:MAG: ATP-binding protein [Desulfobacteraceae bacterium]